MSTAALLRSPLRRLAAASTFQSLRLHRNYRLWFGGQVVSLSGTWVQNVAQAWFVVSVSKSAVALGILALCQFSPYFLFGLFGGAVTDRLDNRRILIGTQTALLASAALLAALVLLGVAQVWEVYVLAIFNGFVGILDNPSRQAFTMQMVGRRELPNAIALNSSLFNTSRVVGPAVGGLLIGGVGVGACFAINAASFIAVIAALVAMRPEELHAPARSQRRGILRESADGLRFAWSDKTIRTATLLMLVVATIAINFNVTLPILTQQTLRDGAAVFGWLSASFGVGALIGALISASLGRPRPWVLVGGALGYGVTNALLAPMRSLAACLVMLLVCGVAFTLFAATTNATVQLQTPDRMRGRVMGIYAYVFFGTAPFGGMLTGWLLQVGGTPLAFGLAGGVTVIAALAVAPWLLGSRLRRGARGAVLSVPDGGIVRE